jgi:hypothetical protein
MIDKRFFGGVILVVTVIVAGVSALPALLLRPVAPEPLAMAVPVTKIAEPIPGRAESSSITRVEPKPVATPVAQSPVAHAQQSAMPPAPQPVAVVLPPAKLPAPQPPAASPSTTPVAFPEVQPIGVATASGPDVAAPASPPPRAASAPRPIAEQPARPERAAQPSAKPRRTVRPAIYPLGEFLAWRR